MIITRYRNASIGGDEVPISHFSLSRARVVHHTQQTTVSEIAQAPVHATGSGGQAERAIIVLAMTLLTTWQAHGRARLSHPTIRS